ncbi:hypothetical protein JOL62DRAFT_371939 [Phyllosticta paracitricarpa]|uniref:BZIP transcription factor n=2 Tax=Phyllosticta TaxID=121621 RepID=A0ABR1L7F9_9PEZI
MSITTIIRPLQSPVEFRSHPSMSNQSNPSISSVKTTPSYEGQSSDADSKRTVTNPAGAATNSAAAPTSTAAAAQNPNAGQPGAKRRPSRAGTRSVSTLTAAQLERKRANDREAQRAIRQRTKDHIENLERRVAELTARESASGKIDEILSRNQDLEQENAILRQRLNHALAAMGQGGYTDNNGLPSESSILASAGTHSPTNRIHIMNQSRPSSTPTARNVPSVTAANAPSIASQADQWHHAHANPHAHAGYSNAPTSTGADSAPAVEVAAPPDPMRWSPHGQHVNAPVSVAENSMHPVDSSVQHSMGYGYVMDTNSRPLQSQYEPQSQQLGYSSHLPVSNPAPPPPSYHDQRHLAVQMPNPQPSYQQYPQPQGYIPSSSQHGDNVPLMQRPPMDNQQMMYSIPSNVKPEQ